MEELKLQQHLIYQHLHLNQPKAHIDYLLKMKNEMNVEPKVIYDIGANVLHWTKNAESIWKDAEIILFDGFDKAEFLYKDRYKYFVGVLGEEDGKEVKWFQNNFISSGNSYYKERNDNIFPEDSFVLKKVRTLSSVVKEHNFPYPDLIKIDVQGCERDIMEGSKDIFKNAKDLIIELQRVDYNLGAPKEKEMIEYIENLGFELITPLFSDNGGVDGDYHFKNKRFSKLNI